MSHPSDEFALSVLKRNLDEYRVKKQTALTHIKWLEGVISHTEQAIRELESGQTESSGSVKPGEFSRMRIYPATMAYLEKYTSGEMVPIRGKLLEALKAGGAVQADGKPLSAISGKLGRDSENEQYRAVMTSLSKHASKGRLRLDRASDTVGLPQPKLLK